VEKWVYNKSANYTAGLLSSIIETYREKSLLCILKLNYMSWFFFLQSTIKYNSRKSTNRHNYKDWKLHRPLITLIKL